MDRSDLRLQIINALRSIAPEVHSDKVDDTINIQDQWDLDSVDVLNFVIKLQDDLHIEIPNKEYKTCLTIQGAAEYLERRLKQSDRPIP